MGCQRRWRTRKSTIPMCWSAATDISLSTGATAASGIRFLTMLVTIRAAAHRLKLAKDGPEMLHLRDAYLEPWTKFATRTALSAAFDLAYLLAMVNRSLSWHHSMAPLAPHHKEPYVDNVPGWLQDFLRAAAPA